MARGKTFKIGNKLINISGRGIATKDTTTGEIRRHAFPWTKKASSPEQPQPEPQPDYDEEASSQEEYEGQPGYYGGTYPEEPYESEPDYDPEEQDYEEPGDYEEERPQNAGLLGSVWFMWLMLIVLPPLGIWLLWRYNRYEITPRSAISAAAVVWFIVILIWLFSHIGGRDNTVVNLPTATPSPSPTVEAYLEPDSTPESTSEAAPETTPDNAASVNQNPSATDDAGTANPDATGDPLDPDSTGAAPSPTPNTAGVNPATATPDPSATGDPSTPDLATATYVWSNGSTSQDIAMYPTWTARTLTPTPPAPT